MLVGECRRMIGTSHLGLGQSASGLELGLDSGGGSRQPGSGLRDFLVTTRSDHPMMVFDRDGNFLSSWGDDVLENAHGIFIDSDDNIYWRQYLE